MFRETLRYYCSFANLLYTAPVVTKTLIPRALSSFRFKNAPALRNELLLARGEFACILFCLADEVDALPSEIAQVPMMVNTVTMAFTPPLTRLGEWIVNYI